MTKEQEKHVNNFGRDRYRVVLAAATLSVRMDARLTGIDRIRKEIAEQAALEASGYPRRAFTMSKLCGVPNRAAEIVAQEAFARAYEAACEAVRKVPA